MTQQPSANDLLNQSGKGVGLKMGKNHAAQGQMLGGKIVSDPQTYHVREFDANNPGNGPLKYFPSGDPIYGLTVDVQTDQRDPSIEDDDGVRRMFIEKKRQLNAVRDAVRQAGASGLAIGGTLYMAWIGEEAGKGASPAMLWAAQYTPPAVTVPGITQPQNTQMTPATPQAAPTPPTTPVEAPAGAVAALGNLNPEQIQQLLAMANQPQA
jgi:hypothetical protein